MVRIAFSFWSGLLVNLDTPLNPKIQNSKKKSSIKKNNPRKSEAKSSKTQSNLVLDMDEGLQSTEKLQFATVEDTLT